MIVAAESSGRSLTLPTLLVGRARERTRLREALAAALAGRGNLVLIGGDLGSGKTTLVRALVREATERGALVQQCQCYDLTQGTAYTLWRDLLEHWPGAPERQGLAGQAPANGSGQALSNLGGHHAPEAAELDRLGRFMRVREFLAAEAAVRPLCLILEDLHWADEASLELLRFLVRGLATLPILIVGTYRDYEVTPQHTLYRLLPLLTREGDATRIDLSLLEDEAVRTLLWSRYNLAPADEARLVGMLRERTGGNPFFIEEFLRTAEEMGVLRHAGELHAAERDWSVGDLATLPVPPLLMQMLDGRIARLGPETARLLAIAATIGVEVPLDLWGQVAQADDEAILALVERAAEAHLVTESPDGRRIRFRHVLLREALYARLSPARRRLWHLRAGELLAAATQPGSDPGAVATHFRRAGDPRAATWLVRASEWSLRTNDWPAAAARLAEAAEFLAASGGDEAMRGWLLYRLARLVRYRDPGAGLAYLREAAAIAESRRDRVLAMLVTGGRGLMRVFGGQMHWAIAELEEAVAVWGTLTPEERERLRALEPEQGDQPPWGTLAGVLAAVGRHREARAIAERVLAEPAEHAASIVDGSPTGNAYSALGLLHTACGALAEARAAFGHARAAFRAAKHPLLVGTVTVRELQAVLRYATDDLATRAYLADEAEEAFGRAGSIGGDLPPRLARTPLLMLEGRWAEVRELVEAVPHPERAAVPVAGVALGPLARAQGDLAAAWRMVEAALPAGLATPPGDAIIADVLDLIRLAVELAYDGNDPITMRSWLDTYDRWLDWAAVTGGLDTTPAAGGGYDNCDSQLGWAGYHRLLGDLARARHHAEAAWACASAPRQPLALLAAARLLGELAIAERDFVAAQGHLDTALSLADACAAPYERALTLVAYADLHLSRADATPARLRLARLALDEIRAICAPLGAVPILARVDTLATRLAGIDPAVAPTTTLLRPAADAPATGDSAAPMPGLALKPGSAGPSSADWLTPRELEVLRLIASGLSNREIATKLFLSVRTAERHIANIYKKIGAHSKADATAFAFSQGLL